MLVSSCGGGGGNGEGPTFSLGGSVKGLQHGNVLVLQEAQAGAVAMFNNGPFVFPERLPTGQGYAVGVATQPPHYNCVITHGAGTMGDANVSSVAVDCTRIFSVYVRVIGLAQPIGLEVQLNGTGTLAIARSGVSTFTQPMTSGDSYAVTIVRQPEGKTCFVSNGEGTIHQEDAHVRVTCPWYIGYFDTDAGIAGIRARYLDEATGEPVVPLGPFASAPTLIEGASRFDVSVSGEYLYLAADDRIEGYRINPVTGELSLANTTPVAEATSIKLSHDGTLLFRTSSAELVGYRVNADGSLNEVSRQPLRQGGEITIDPLGRFLFAVGDIDAPGHNVGVEPAIHGYAIDPATGMLNLIHGYPVRVTQDDGQNSEHLYNLRVNPLGRFLYVRQWDEFKTHEPDPALTYPIDPSTGVLGTPALQHVYSVAAFSLDGQKGYGAETGEVGYSYGGSLDPVTGTMHLEFRKDNWFMRDLVLEPDGKFLYSYSTWVDLDASTGAFGAFHQAPPANKFKPMKFVRLRASP